MPDACSSRSERYCFHLHPQILYYLPLLTGGCDWWPQEYPLCASLTLSHNQTSRSPPAQRRSASQAYLSGCQCSMHWIKGIDRWRLLFARGHYYGGFAIVLRVAIRLCLPIKFLKTNGLNIPCWISNWLPLKMTQSSIGI